MVHEAELLALREARGNGQGRIRCCGRRERSARAERKLTAKLANHEAGKAALERAQRSVRRQHLNVERLTRPTPHVLGGIPAISASGAVDGITANAATVKDETAAVSVNTQPATSP